MHSDIPRHIELPFSSDVYSILSVTKTDSLDLYLVLAEAASEKNQNVSHFGIFLYSKSAETCAKFMYLTSNTNNHAAVRREAWEKYFSKIADQNNIYSGFDDNVEYDTSLSFVRKG